MKFQNLMSTVASFRNGTKNIINLTNIFRFNYLFTRIQKRVRKNNSKMLRKNKTIVKDRYFRFETWSISNEVFKYQAKFSSRSGVCVLGEWLKYTLPSSPLFKDESLRDIGHSMSIENLIWGVNSVTVSHLIHYGSLLQNATVTSLQNATEGYYKMCQVFYYKIRKFNYKLQHLFQITTIFY